MKNTNRSNLFKARADILEAVPDFEEFSLAQKLEFANLLRDYATAAEEAAAPPGMPSRPPSLQLN